MVCVTLNRGKTDPNCVTMCLEALTVRQRDNHWPQISQTLLGDLLRGDVLLEREGVYATELASVSIGWKCVVGTRRIVSAAISIYEHAEVLDR